mgnify:CR=1 FL=1
MNFTSKEIFLLQISGVQETLYLRFFQSLVPSNVFYIRAIGAEFEWLLGHFYFYFKIMYSCYFYLVLLLLFVMKPF